MVKGAGASQKRSFLEIESYINKLENKQNIYRDVEFTITVQNSHSLKPIDTFLKRAIDHFNKIHKELMGFVGYWNFQQVNNILRLSHFIWMNDI